jgi:hypothetical protein
MMHHSLSPEDGRLAEARAMIQTAFVIEPSPSIAAPPVPVSRVLEVIR